MTAQAGAVAWRWLWADGSRASEWFDGFPTEAAVRNGAEKGAHVEYLTPPAAVPVEALEGLLDKAQFLVDGLDEEYVAWPTRVLMLRAELTELTQLIKERSNGQ